MGKGGGERRDQSLPKRWILASVRCEPSPAMPNLTAMVSVRVSGVQILVLTGSVLRFDVDPKEKERGLAMLILGAISESPPLPWP